MKVFPHYSKATMSDSSPHAADYNPLTELEKKINQPESDKGLSVQTLIDDAMRLLTALKRVRELIGFYTEYHVEQPNGEPLFIGDNAEQAVEIIDRALDGKDD